MRSQRDRATIRLLLHEIHDSLKSRVSIGLESTLSGTTHAKLIQHAKTLGYQIELHYLWIPSPELAICRIRQRVKMGGHAIPDDDVKRRFSRSLDHFLNLYAPLADRWTFQDNTQQPAALLFESAVSTIAQVREFLRP